jgi:hypothetical protein
MPVESVAMNSQRSGSDRFVPRLEALSDRWCPSVTVQRFGSELWVLGNGAADTVSVTDNGQGQVSVTADGRTVTRTGVKQIQVRTGAGDDVVNYTLTGPATRESRLKIDLGSGNDTATLEADGVRLGARVEVDVNGGLGNDAITADYAVEADNRFRIRLDGGLGNDTVTGTVALAAGSTGEVEARVTGGLGNDRLTLNVTGTADELEARLDGDTGFDRWAATPNVRLRGVEGRL